VDVKVPEHLRHFIRVAKVSEGWPSILAMAKKERRIVVLDNTNFQLKDSYQELTKLILQLPVINRTTLHTHIFLALREAGSLVFSHLKLNTEAGKSRVAVLQMVRESRHNRITWCMDTQRFGDVYKGMRDNLDVTIIKNTPVLSTPTDLMPIVRYIRGKGELEGWKKWPAIHFLSKNRYYEAWASGQVYLSQKKMASFHHKNEEDNFVSLSGVQFIIEDLAALDAMYGSDEQLGKKEVMYRARIAMVAGALLRAGAKPEEICALNKVKRTDYLAYLRGHHPKAFVGKDGKSLNIWAPGNVPLAGVDFGKMPTFFDKEFLKEEMARPLPI
jgi:hypothetical protein